MTRPEPSACPPSEVHVTPSTSEGLRLRVPDGSNGCERAPSRTDTPDSVVSSISSTQRKARSYTPGPIRVRFSALKDILVVLRLRYMSSLYYTSCVGFVIQFGLWAYHKPEVVVHIPNETVADACAQLWAELRGLLPLFLVMVGSFLMRRDKSVYLLDFALFEPPAEWCSTRENIMTILKNAGKIAGSFQETELEFMRKVLVNSGTGDSTAWPPGIIRCQQDAVPQDQSMKAAREEAETVICSCLESLFERTGVQPKEVDFFIINCSLFSPTPSLCAMACNRFQMRSGVKTFNLSGMGCSASLIAVDLAAELLQNNPNSLAIVVSTELITQSLYHGAEKSMLLQNTLFRCGGAAICLTNKPRLAGRARYRLRHLVRTQCADDDSYGAVYQCEDPKGASGIRLSKEIVKIAGKCMTKNLTQLGPLVLPIFEQVRVLGSIVRRKLKGSGSGAVYVPSFRSAVHYFCIHAGGRAVLDGIEKNLRLLPEDLEASRAVLHSQGNTSSSSIWYELRYIEEHKDLRRGHKILQLAFGSGFKCNSAVWTRMR